jgi:aldehyde decarbonylase
VDGTSLAAAVVMNNVPQGTNQVILAGKISKVARTVALALCKKNVEVRTKYPHLLLYCNQKK